MEVILVRGEQPGPALWKVSSGEHVLWILGTASPLPHKVKWRSRQFEGLLAKSQEVLIADTREIRTNDPREAQAAFDGRYLPKGQTLKDALSPELYARVEAARKVWRVPDELDALRPHAVATHFANAAVWSMNLRVFPATHRVSELARKAKVKVTPVSVPDAHASFADSMETLVPGDTAPCVAMVLNAMEDRGAGMKRLANAWAVGDIATLRELAPIHEISSSMGRQNPEGFACVAAAVGSAQRARRNIEVQTNAWLEASARALRETESTMAVVPLVELFAADGYLAGMRSRGYEIDEPR
jgi:uncharacterized protein YbaP (TraB family)